MKVGKNANSHSTPELTREQLDYYHQKGIIPDWVYYPRIGETPTETLYSQHDQKQLEKQIEVQLEQFINQTLDDLLKDFK